MARLTNINIPSPNPALREILRSQTMRSLVMERAEMAEAVYRGRVAKVTSELARSTRVTTAIGGTKNDRWVAFVTAHAPYAAYHEFGTRRHAGAHDFRAALAALGGVG